MTGHGALPFLVAGPMGLVGVYLRSRMAETPIFREIEAREEEESRRHVGLRHAAHPLHRGPCWR